MVWVLYPYPSPNNSTAEGGLHILLGKIRWHTGGEFSLGILSTRERKVYSKFLLSATRGKI